MKYFILVICLLFSSVSYASDYVVKQKIVEFDNDYFQGVNGYYYTANSLRKRHEQEQQLENDEKLEEIAELLRGISEKLGNKVPTEPESEEEVPVEPETPDTEEISDLNKKVFNIFSKNCGNCHNDAKPTKDLSLVGEENGQKFLYDLPLSDRVLVHHVTKGVNLDKTGHKLMPVGGPPLNQEDVTTLELWMIEKAVVEKKLLIGETEE